MSINLKMSEDPGKHDPLSNERNLFGVHLSWKMSNVCMSIKLILSHFYPWELIPNNISELLNLWTCLISSIFFITENLKRKS